MSSEKDELHERVIDLESMQNKIKKQNELVEELNTQFYGLSVDELGQEINQSMFDMLIHLRKQHVKQIINGSLDLKYLLKEHEMFDLLSQLQEVEGLVEDSDEEFDHSQKEQSQVDSDHGKQDEDKSEANDDQKSDKTPKSSKVSKSDINFIYRKPIRMMVRPNELVEATNSKLM